MRSLIDCFEGILDADFDINDDAILPVLVKKATGIQFDHELPGIKTNGEWLIFDCANRHKDIFIGSLVPLINAGYTKYRFINCENVELYHLYDGTNTNSWSGFEIDAPNAIVCFSGNTHRLELADIKINSHAIYIEANEAGDTKVIMNHCKFDIAEIIFQAVSQLSIASTCKFIHCKLLYLGGISGSVARKALGLLMGDVCSGQSFQKEIKRWQCADETKYWDIDVMKTLSLKADKWPDLGKIVLVPNGILASTAPGICLYKLSKSMLPASLSSNGEIVEFMDGWSGQHVKSATMEKYCVVK